MYKIFRNIKNNPNEHFHQSLQTESQNGNLLNPYDTIFDSETNQIDIHHLIGKEIIKDDLLGYNGTIFAYGKSGS